MRDMFNRPVGWSDHTNGEVTSLASVALGGGLIEKHFTLDRNLPGPDHKASLEPAGLESFIENVRILERALGDGRKRPTKAELDTARVARRSLVILSDMAAATRFRLRTAARGVQATDLRQKCWMICWD